MKRESRAQRETRAFTLIELMIVVGIIGVLAVLLVPALRAAKVQGYSSKSASNLHQLALANLAYAADNGTYSPSQDTKNRKRWHGERTGGAAKFDPHKGFLAPYLGGDGAVKQCPLLQRVMQEGSFELGTGGYGYNAAYIGGRPGDPFTPESPMNVPRPAETVMFTTTAFARGEEIQEYAYAEPFVFESGSGGGGSGAKASVHFRVNGMAIVAWCDGHVTYEKPTKIETDRENGEVIGWFGPEEENGYWNPRRNF